MTDGANHRDAAHPGHPYRGASLALLTCHRKEAVLAPAFLEAFGAEVQVVDHLDTDTLGTFTRDVPRAGSQLDAARRKARLACELSGRALGLGSEGAFLPGPLGFGTWNLELVVLIDVARELEVVGRAHQPGFQHHGVVTDLAALDALAARAGFPAHALVVRPDHADDPRLRKGLTSPATLHDAFHEALRASSTGRVFVESDLRAHLNPSRMKVIAEATRDLIERLARRCTACDAPGFGKVGVVEGLPCALCGAPTREALADTHGCARCDHLEHVLRPGATRADPGRCDLCNP